MGWHKYIFIILVGSILLSCSRRLSECEGPEIDFAAVNSIRNNLTQSGPQAALVLPNPIDATRNPLASTSDAVTLSSASGLFLRGLLNPVLLENNFLKVRLHALDDDYSLLAQPDTTGAFRFQVSDPHYSETMAYYSVTTLMSYIETLGFSFVKSRPLYVLARAEDPGGDTNTINAYYEHNYLQPSLPRIMRLIGNGEFAPGADRDMYWHEMGHLLNESVSREVGIDLAGDRGAIYTNASALHECGADFFAESFGNKNFIGKWINRNFEPNKPGEPLRSAVDRPGDQLKYSDVANFDGTGQNPERYNVAEWCTRVLWDFRSQIVKEDPARGAVIADRVVLSAISLLKKDTSIQQFQQALVQADEKLHCGLHKRSIQNAFESRGFQVDVDQLDGALAFDAAPVRASGENEDIVFSFRVTNNQGKIARNVRVQLETRGNGFHTVRYLQGFGDLPAGKSIVVGSNGLSSIFSVGGVFDSTGSGKITYRISVLVENGPTATKEGEIPR